MPDGPHAPHAATPEAHAEVDIEVLAEHEDDAEDDDGELRRITGRVPSFAPIPSARSVAEHGVPEVDTWVEITFAGADGSVLPSLRRAERRSANGVVQAQEPDLNAIGMLPIDALAATLMPAQIAHMSLHASSDMGRAITDMLGFQPLRSVAEYARKSREKLSRAMPRDINRDLAGIKGGRFDPARAAFLEETPSSLALNDTDVPEFDDPDVAERLDALVTRVDAAEAAALDRARAILGTTFDPTRPAARTALRKDATLATDKLAAAELDKTSGARLIRTLHDLAPEQIATEREHLGRLTSQAAEIVQLAANETLHARERLYALVAQDMSTNGLGAEHLDHCPVCRSDLSDRTDPVSGDLVADHIRRMLQADAKHLAQTLTEWAGQKDADLRARLPSELFAAEGLDLDPVDLIARTVASALDAPCFRGALAPLTASTRNDVVAALGTLPALAPTPPRTMPAAADLPASVTELERTVQRLQLAFDVAEWLHHHLDAASTRLRDVLGFSWPRRADADAEATAPAGSVLDRLLAIDTTIEHAQPLQEANARLRSMQDADRDARALRTKRAQFAEAAHLLPQIEALEAAFTRQMHEVVESMCDRTAEWKQALYNPATSRAPRFRDIHVDAKEALSLDTAVEGTTVSSWHVSNASDLRATLLAFLFAFRERLQAEGGGCSMLLLDDPQELFDDRNRISVAAGIARLAGDGSSTRVVLTTNSRRFAQELEQRAKSAGRTHERLRIFPAQHAGTTARLLPPNPDLNRLRKAFLDAEHATDADERARDYAYQVRIHLESCLSGVIDRYDEHDGDGLASLCNKLRGAIKRGIEPFTSINEFNEFATHPQLQPKTAFFDLVNAVHHKDAASVYWIDVNEHSSMLLTAQRLLDNGCEQYFRYTELPRLRAADGRS